MRFLQASIGCWKIDSRRISSCSHRGLSRSFHVIEHLRLHRRSVGNDRASLRIDLK